MKKYLLALATLAVSAVASAQIVGGYKATTKQDISLKGATVITSTISQGNLYLNGTNGSGSLEGTGYAIGFDFPFNGQEFKYFGVSAQGLIKLSTTENVSMDINDSFYGRSSEGSNNVIYSYDQYADTYDEGNADGYEPTVISYKSSDDELVVEWKNLGINTSSWRKKLVGTYTMQIHLLKDGTIKYTYAGLSDLTTTGAGHVMLGVRGGEGEYMMWDGFAAQKGYYAENKAFSLSPINDGYTITLNTPGEIQTPTAQPTDLQVKYTYEKSVTATATFTQAEGVDKYLVLASQGAPTATPVDGTVYAKGDTLGNAQILLAGTPGLWGTSCYDLNHDTDYTFTVYGYNSFGTGEVKYNTVEPLQGTFHTAPCKPTDLKVLATSKTSLKLSVAANANNDDVIVVYNDSVYNPENMGNRAYVGKLDASLQAGDYLKMYENDSTVIDDQAGKVAYFGKAGEFEITGLDPSRSYYFLAYSYNEASGVFSQGADTAQVWTSTNIAIPYTMDLQDAPDSQMPGGWVAEPGSYNYGFRVLDANDRNLSSQTEGNRVIYCENTDNSVVYTLTSPVIDLTADNAVSFDWHIHVMGAGWFAQPAAYEEWGTSDSLAFVLHVDGQKIVLKKYTAANAPEDEDGATWHSESFDLKDYAGKQVQFGVEWLGAKNERLRVGLENIKVTGVESTGIEAPETSEEAKANGKTYNLGGQQVSAKTRGVVIKDGKKMIVR